MCCPWLPLLHLSFDFVVPCNWKGCLDSSLANGSIFQKKFLLRTFSESEAFCCRFYVEPLRMFSCLLLYLLFLQHVLLLIAVQLVYQEHCAYAVLTLVPFLGEGYSSEVTARLTGTEPRVRANETFHWVNTDSSRLRSLATLVTFPKETRWPRPHDLIFCFVGAFFLLSLTELLLFMRHALKMIDQSLRFCTSAQEVESSNPRTVSDPLLGSWVGTLTVSLVYYLRLYHMLW